MTRPRIIVWCESSGLVRDEFTALGWDAWSCDRKPTERPGQHIQGDALKNLRGYDLAIGSPKHSRANGIIFSGRGKTFGQLF